MSSVDLAMPESWSIASSSRLRSCIIFWLRSGWFQKSGELTSSSVLVS
jgi:hypothetical protein